jgi:crotonobetainyl-CoA:carnitine CoA-transferase CaiB-like acyl-CoA transferase
MAALPLEGVRVLELGTSIAGPYCTLILSALGADVVKLEPLGRGDDTREWGPPFWSGESATFLAVNAGKRSLAVDLRSPQGVDVALRLAARADVLVQNLRPGLAEELGLAFEVVAGRNDRVVYCSIGSFGTSGPLSAEPGYDPLMQAAGGIMSLTGEPDGAPLRCGASLVDQGTGMWAVIAILAALRERDRGAGAQLVDTSLYETAVGWLPYQMAGYLASGVAPRPLGTGISILAPYQAFRASDGWVMVAAGNDRLYQRLRQALDLPDDPCFASNRLRVEHREALASLIGEVVAGWTVDETVARLRTAGVPVAPVADLAEVAASEQTRALGLLQPVPHPDVPDLRLVSLPVTVNGERRGHRGPPPRLGEHTRELLAEAGLDYETVDELVRAGVVAARDTA